MAEDKAPVRRRRMGAHGMMFRRRRIFAKLREGFTYEEIAAEEGVSPSRIRQIVSQGAAATRRSTAGPNMRSCNWTASRPRCSSRPRRSPPATSRRSRLISRRSTGSTAIRSLASANQVYDDEARKKLMDKINRLGREFRHRRELRGGGAGALEEPRTDAPRRPVEAEGQGAIPADAAEFVGEANAPDAPPVEEQAGAGFFYANWP